MEHIFSVKDINRYIKVFLESNRDLQGILIRGEVSNCKYHSSGHLYFTLKDENSQMQAVMWRDRVKEQDFKIADGSKIIAEGNIALYEKGGYYQFNLYSYKDDGIGNLYVAFEELKRKLAQEGLFDEEYKLELPPSPRKIALITSITGAVVHDFLTVTKRRNKSAKVVVIPTPMQGTEALPHIISSIERAQKLEEVDLIVLARGGGSFEDLNLFNSEALARAIFAAKKPIISAIGHETDVTISDFVADKRAATPSVAAELASANMQNAGEYIKELYKRILKDVTHIFNERDWLLKNITEKRVIKEPISTIFTPKEQNIDNVVDSILYLYEKRIAQREKRLELAVSKIEALNPLKVMERGFTYITDDEGKMLKSAKTAQKKDDYTINFADGAIKAKKV